MKKLTSKDFVLGMKVRITDVQIAQLKVAFAKKVKDRVGIVTWISKYDNYEDARNDPFYASHINTIGVEFQQRNGRGKLFREMLPAHYFEILP